MIRRLARRVLGRLHAQRHLRDARARVAVLEFQLLEQRAAAVARVAELERQIAEDRCAAVLAEAVASGVLTSAEAEAFTRPDAGAWARDPKALAVYLKTRGRPSERQTEQPGENRAEAERAALEAIGWVETPAGWLPPGWVHARPLGLQEALEFQRRAARQGEKAPVARA